MAILGIDYGQSHIGLAFSEGLLARPYKVLKNDRNFLAQLKKICQSQEIGEIVLGLPEGKSQREIKKFARKVEEQTRLPVFLVSEVMSTREALARLIQSQRSKKYRKKTIDASSAAVILESYLNQAQPKEKDEI
jgi:putative Holliday junction resolvase